MPAVVPGFPLDHQMWVEIENAHLTDGDPQSTNLAVRIVGSALAHGHPADAEIAGQVLTGPGAAAAVQGVMQPYLEQAETHHTVAHEHSKTSVQLAREGLACAEQLRALPAESVDLADGSSLTRWQVLEAHSQRRRVASQREGRGDFEHLALAPSWLTRLGIAVPIAVIEASLLIWPVTNASWDDPKSIAYVAALASMFLYMNDQLPRWAGCSVRDAREARTAAAELTVVGITAGCDGDRSRGRGLLGEIDEPLLARTRRSAIIWMLVMAIVVVTYGTVMFTRVVGLAEGLRHGLWFSTLAAALITTFTVAGPIFMTWRWARGNRLGDQLRETGAITVESRAAQDHLTEMALTAARRSEDAADRADAEFTAAAQTVEDGQRTIARGLQKAADILRQPTVVAPLPQNLYQASQPWLTDARRNLDTAASLRAQILEELKEPPFPALPIDDPWLIRSGRRAAQPNPAFVPDSQLGDLHAPRTPHRQATRWRFHRCHGQR